jgi:hypothetical protein
MIIQGIAKSASVFLAALVCAVAIAGVGRGAAQDQSPPPPQDQSRPDQAPVDAASYAKMSRDQLGPRARSVRFIPMTRGRKWNRNALQFLFEGGAQCTAPEEGTYAL